jgi:hypothetical protein
VVTDRSVVFQPRFGLKQDRPGHRSPPIRFSLSPHAELCPVRHLAAYLEATATRRSSPVLFVTTTPPHRTAARATLRQWFAQTLMGAGITASPGSARSTVASTALARGLSDNAIMQSADWSSSQTLYSNYVRVLPAEALRRDTVQSTIDLLPD